MTKEQDMYRVDYTTMNDTYTKYFKTLTEANSFCEMIKKLYPGQEPTIY